MNYDIMTTRHIKKAVRIIHPSDVIAIVIRYAKLRQENFLVLTLNGSHEVIAIHIVTIGLVNKTIVHPREVFVRAIKDMSSAIIVCHNHPSGKTDPSDEDLDITRRLIKAADILGIRFLDHIIITKHGYKSLRQEGILEDLKGEYKGGENDTVK